MDKDPSPSCEHERFNSRATSQLIQILRRVAVRRGATAECATTQSATVDYSTDIPTPVERANPEKLKEVFEKYATLDVNGEPRMTKKDFVCKYLGLLEDDNYNKNTLNLLAGAADTTKDGEISYEEFAAFEAILCSHDALYLTAFEMFDTNASETITIDEFEIIIRQTSLVTNVPFDINSDFYKLYFGRDHGRSITYMEFCQLLHDLHEEQAVQAFRHYDRERAGKISAVDFHNLMMNVKPHMLSKFMRANLVALASGSAGSQVSFPWFMAFNELIAKIEIFKRIYLTVAKGNYAYEMTREEFLLASQSYAQITPLEIAILFQLAELRHPGRGQLVFQDLERIDPERLKRVSNIMRLTNMKIAESPQDRGFVVQLLESAYRFALGAIAGAAGATAVYPIDLGKFIPNPSVSSECLTSCA